MPENIKALIAVLVLSVPAFYIGRPLTASTVAPREFAVWRNAWFASTVAAFLTGDFLIFLAIVPMICLYARANRVATVALFFVLLLAVPLGNWQIGGLGIVNALFAINNARLLTIVLLLPLLLATGSSGRRNGGASAIPDLLIVGYVLLTIALKFEQWSATQIMRFATVQTLDVLIPYFAFSRAVTNIGDIQKVLLAFVVAMLPLSMIGVIEFIKHWHLYAVINNEWGGALGYIERGGMLRGSASATEPIAFGFIIMVAIGSVLAVRQTILSQRFTGIALAIFAAGLVASLSRGPWVGAAVLLLTYLAIGPNSVANLGKTAVAGCVALLALLLTPVGQRLLNFLPFVGSMDAGSVTYRQRLYENAIRVIERNPWFGSSDYLSTPEMKEMIQGEQIIDIVNTYLGIALNSGVVGLGLFLAFFASILIGLRRVLKIKAVRESGFNACARALMATLVAMLVTIATVSSVDFIPYVYWSIAGLSVALIRITYRDKAAVARASHVRPVAA